MRNVLKVIAAVITAVVACFAIMLATWSLSPEGAVRTEIMLDFHPIKAIQARPKRDKDFSDNLIPEGVPHGDDYDIQNTYLSSDASYYVSDFIITHHGPFYFAQVIPPIV